MSRIYLSAPDVGESEEEAIVAAVRSGWIAPLGPDVDAFEQAVAARTERRHAVALSSGTAALHLALLGQGVGRGDVVFTSTMTFAATANAIRYVGGEPFFIDSDEATGNMDPSLLEQALADFAARGESVAAVMPVDLFGKVADYTSIEPLAASYGAPVIADSAESLGAAHAGRPAGAYGVSAALSFNGNKVMTTSSGGMLLTDDEALAQHARYLATQARQPVPHYEHVDIGYNYRLSNILAALGRAQLQRLDSMIARRREHRARYRGLFADAPGVTILGGAGDDDDNFWLTCIVVDPDAAGWTSTELAAWLADDDIETRPLWKPMHMQPVFAGARSLVNGVSEQLFRTGLALPSGSSLTTEQIRRIDTQIQGFLEHR